LPGIDKDRTLGTVRSIIMLLVVLIAVMATLGQNVRVECAPRKSPSNAQPPRKGGETGVRFSYY